MGVRVQSPRTSPITALTRLFYSFLCPTFPREPSYVAQVRAETVGPKAIHLCRQCSMPPSPTRAPTHTCQDPGPASRASSPSLSEVCPGPRVSYVQRSEGGSGIPGFLQQGTHPATGQRAPWPRWAETAARWRWGSRRISRGTGRSQSWRRPLPACSQGPWRRDPLPPLAPPCSRGPGSPAFEYKNQCRWAGGDWSGLARHCPLVPEGCPAWGGIAIRWTESVPPAPMGVLRWGEATLKRG